MVLRGRWGCKSLGLQVRMEGGWRQRCPWAALPRLAATLLSAQHQGASQGAGGQQPGTRLPGLRRELQGASHKYLCKRINSDGAVQLEPSPELPSSSAPRCPRPARTPLTTRELQHPNGGPCPSALPVPIRPPAPPPAASSVPRSPPPCGLPVTPGLDLAGGSTPYRSLGAANAGGKPHDGQALRLLRASSWWPAWRRCRCPCTGVPAPSPLLCPSDPASLPELCMEPGSPDSPAPGLRGPASLFSTSVISVSLMKVLLMMSQNHLKWVSTKW